MDTTIHLTGVKDLITSQELEKLYNVIDSEGDWRMVRVKNEEVDDFVDWCEERGISCNF